MAEAGSLEAYAAMLDQLKADQPDQYAEIMAQLHASTSGADNGRQGERVTPEPAFVIKTTTIPAARSAVSGGTKVFINVTHSPRVPGFRKRRHFVDGKEVEGLHVPIAIGPPRNDVDHAGKRCLVYDIIVNTEVTMGCTNTSDGGSFRQMVCSIVLENVQAKHGRKATPPWTLNPAFKLPKLGSNYKGSLPAPAQWVRAARSAGIEPVDDTAAAAAAAETESKPMSATEAAQPASVAAAMSIMGDVARSAPAGPDGIVRVDMSIKRLGEEEEDGKTTATAAATQQQDATESATGIDRDTRTLESLTSVGRSSSAGDKTGAAVGAVSAAEDVVASRLRVEEPGHGAEHTEAREVTGSLIVELDDTEIVQPAVTKPTTSSAELLALKSERRVRRRAERKALTPITPAVCLHKGFGDEEVADPARWLGVPHGWRQTPTRDTETPTESDVDDSSRVTAVSVRMPLDLDHPTLLTSVERALSAAQPDSDEHETAWRESFGPGQARTLVELCGMVRSPHRVIECLSATIALRLQEELLRVDTPGHTPCSVLLPIVATHGVDPAITLSLRPAELVVRVTSCEWRRSGVDAGVDGSTPLLCSQVAPVNADTGVPEPRRSLVRSRPSDDGVSLSSSKQTPDAAVGEDSSLTAPVPEHEALPEDRFHAQDPMSQHFLQEKERSKADAEQKRIEKEAASKAQQQAAPPPQMAPSAMDLESEADIGLL